MLNEARRSEASTPDSSQTLGMTQNSETSVFYDMTKEKRGAIQLNLRIRWSTLSNGYDFLSPTLGVAIGSCQSRRHRQKLGANCAVDTPRFHMDAGSASAADAR